MPAGRYCSTTCWRPSCWLLALYPCVGAGVLGGAALKLLTSVVLISGIYAVSNRRRQIVIALVALAGGPALASGWIFLLTAVPVFDIAESIFCSSSTPLSRW